MKNKMRNMAFGIGVMALLGCSSYSNIIKMQKVTNIPDGQYERIIKLNNPEGNPYRTLAGLVFVKKDAKICTDYPREMIIKSLDELEMAEKSAYPFFANYIIKDDGETLGFVSISMDYRANLWKNKKDVDCKYKVEIIIPDNSDGMKDMDHGKKGRSGDGHH